MTEGNLSNQHNLILWLRGLNSGPLRYNNLNLATALSINPRSYDDFILRKTTSSVRDTGQDSETLESTE